jgi:N-acyl-D-aspartate/D-glutamate deacylase
MEFDVLILGGMLVDGTGAVKRREDIGIVGDSIVAVGNMSSASAKQVIDAAGKIISPGFIDIHTHSDLTLLAYPDAASRVRQGITTEVVGNCSYSPYPVTPAVKEFMTPCLTQGQCTADWNWADLEGFRRRVEEIGVAVNVVPLVGHGSIRIAAMEAENRAPTSSELDRMRRLAAEAMDQGAFGISTGLTLAPSSYAQTAELIEISRVVAAKGGFYATHSRLWAGYHFKAVEESIQIGHQAEISVQISHQTIIDSRYFGQSKTIVEMMEQARSEGVDVLYDVYPYTAGATKCDQLLPDFALSDGTEMLLKRLRNPSERAGIRAAASEGWFNGIPWQWERIQLTHVREQAYHKFVGRTLSEVADILQIEPLDCLLHLIESQQNDVSVVMFNRDEADVQFFLSHPLSMIGSDGAAISPRGQSLQTKPHPRYYGTFPRVLGRYVRELGAMTLEDAVRKMTSAPAARLGLKDRGVIARGKKADIVVFDPDKISDQSSFEDPHRFPTGIDYVFVNGQPVVTPDGTTPNRPGAVLAR